MTLPRRLLAAGYVFCLLLVLLLPVLLSKLCLSPSVWIHISGKTLLVRTFHFFLRSGGLFLIQFVLNVRPSVPLSWSNAQPEQATRALFRGAIILENLTSSTLLTCRGLLMAVGQIVPKSEQRDEENLKMH